VTDTSPEWNNWHWQYQSRICDAEALSYVLDLSDTKKERVTRCLTRFRMAITPYYASLIDPLDPGDPIRLGTRILVTMPMRITPELLRMLKKYQPIWINTHFNHPKELTEAAVWACTQIVDAGFPLGNQCVLLKGVNDNAGVMRELMRKLIQVRVHPYYLYQCDLSEGLEHFRTDVRVGINIIKELHGSIAGFAVPSFVIDAPGGGGKIPLSPDYIVSVDDERIVMKNYYGDNYEYPQPSGKCSMCHVE